MYVYNGSVENGSLKRCVACLQNSKRSTSIDLKKKSMDHLARHYQRNHDRTNRKQDEDFPQKKTNRRFRFKISVVCIPSIPRKASCIFWGKHLHRLAKLLRRKPIQLTMRIPDTCCCSDVPRHTCSRWK